MGTPGSKVYSPEGLNAAAALGKALDEQRTAGTIAPPASGLVLGIDWGENTHAVILWPLERGGFYVAEEIVCTHLEPGESSTAIVDQLNRMALWPGADDILGQRRQHRLTLLREVRYDSAGVQSQRTFSATARRQHPRLKVEKVPFNAYKRETIGYLRRLVNRAGAGERTQVLAIGSRAPELLRQMRGLEWPDDGDDMPVDGDDHGPDALIAGSSDVARRYRDLLNGT